MYTNMTPHYELPQYTDNDIPSYLTDFNETMSKLDDILYEQGENMAVIERGNAQIQQEMSEIRIENNALQTEILEVRTNQRSMNQKIDGLTDAVNAITGDTGGGLIPEWRDPTSSDFDPTRYEQYIYNNTVKTNVNMMYPVGIIVAFANTADPNTLFSSASADVDFDSTWVALDEGKVLVQGNTTNVGTNNGVTANAKTASVTVSGNVTLSGNTGGTGLSVANLPAHTHTASLPTNAQCVGAFSGATQTTLDFTPGGALYMGTPTISVSGGGNGTSTGTAHSHSIAGDYPASLSGSVSYNAESPAIYVRYWKRTA